MKIRVATNEVFDPKCRTMLRCNGVTAENNKPKTKKRYIFALNSGPIVQWIEWRFPKP